MIEALKVLRDDGWSVAVHNDYQQDGEAFTFWLLTHPDGRYVKGEGRTDTEALDYCFARAATTLMPPPVSGGEEYGIGSCGTCSRRRVRIGLRPMCEECSIVAGYGPFTTADTEESE